MATNLPDLWPDDIAVTNDLRTPITILRQQAALLGKKTQNLVEAEISSENRNGAFWYGFNLVAPALDNYRFRLFSIVHNINFYPVEIDFFAVDGIVKVESEKAFLEELRKLFSSEETKRVIRALIAQSQA